MKLLPQEKKAIAALEEKGYEIVNTLFTDEWYSKDSMKERGVVQIPLCFMAKGLENMSYVHAALILQGMGKRRGWGCRMNTKQARHTA